MRAQYQRPVMGLAAERRRSDNSCVCGPTGTSAAYASIHGLSAGNAHLLTALVPPDRKRVKTGGRGLTE
ncbi:MAG: hypothetical protein ABFS21_09850 [Actinomycetota bacterium]